MFYNKSYRMRSIKTLTRYFSSIDNKELTKFNTTTDWWNPNGSMKALHAYNSTRLDFIKRIMIRKNKATCGFYFMEHNSVLDVGCGGGLLTEAMANLGGYVKGVDANSNSIKIAQHHLDEYSPHLTTKLNYECITLEDHIKTDGFEKYDIVTAMEVLEHVNDLPQFFESLSIAIKQDGIIVMSTLNKSLLSYMFNIVAAEYILRLLPTGTHDYNKFFTPEELIRLAKTKGLHLVALDYNLYDPITNQFYRDILFRTNYLIAFEKLN